MNAFLVHRLMFNGFRSLKGTPMAGSSCRLPQAMANVQQGLESFHLLDAKSPHNNEVLLAAHVNYE